jgi:hypothetical protein
MKKAWYAIVSMASKYKHDGYTINQILDRLEAIFGIIRSRGLSQISEKSIVNMWFIIINVMKDRIDVEECLSLMERKRSNYSNRPLYVTGQIGVIVRQIAKFHRYINMEANNKDDAESLQDTLVDIFNYAIIGVELSTPVLIKELMVENT